LLLLVLHARSSSGGVAEAQQHHHRQHKDREEESQRGGCGDYDGDAVLDFDDDVVLIKVGGSSITDKSSKETVDREALDWFARTLSGSASSRYRAPVPTECSSSCNAEPDDDYDCGANGGWFGRSRRALTRKISSAAAVLAFRRRRHPVRTAMSAHDRQSELCSNKDARPVSSDTSADASERRSRGVNSGFVVVHGAGSFGHHTAKEYGLTGKSEPPTSRSFEPTTSTHDNSTIDDQLEHRQRYAMQGLAQTRSSVQALNRMVVESLLHRGINAVGISPCFGIPTMQAHGGGSTTIQLLQDAVHAALNAGLIPVLHGDACLYGPDDVGILSGDTVMEMLGTPTASWISRAVFLTDVDGVYSRDPKTDPSAKLLREIAVDGSKSELVLIPSLDSASGVEGGPATTINLEASGSTHQHDVTGGLKVRNCVKLSCVGQHFLLHHVLIILFR